MPDTIRASKSGKGLRFEDLNLLLDALMGNADTRMADPAIRRDLQRRIEETLAMERRSKEVSRPIVPFDPTPYLPKVTLYMSQEATIRGIAKYLGLSYRQAWICVHRVCLEDPNAAKEWTRTARARKNGGRPVKGDQTKKFEIGMEAKEGKGNPGIPSREVYPEDWEFEDLRGTDGGLLDPLFPIQNQESSEE